MTVKEISAIISEVINAKEFAGKYGNGSECTFRRTYIEGREYTLVDGKLYMGERYFDGERETYSTITRIKEGRREDRLEIDGICARFAPMIAMNIKSSEDFFKTC